MLILNGKQVAQAHQVKLSQEVAVFAKTYGRRPGLAVILVGDDPASHVYVRNKEKACQEVGIVSFRYALPKHAAQAEVEAQLAELAVNPMIDGILVQFPLPHGLSQDRVLEAISPQKDADGLTFANLGYLLAGKATVQPCTPHGVMQILAHYGTGLAGRHAVVVGRSHIVGKPMAQMLLNADATVTVCHSKTQNLAQYTRQGDVVVVAAGRPNFLGRDDFKPGAVVVDVGIHRLAGGLCGDVRFAELEGHVSAATPVPGGVGPMTIAMLLDNTLRLAERRMSGIE